jgi:hypothetical protein
MRIVELRSLDKQRAPTRPWAETLEALRADLWDTYDPQARVWFEAQLGRVRRPLPAARKAANVLEQVSGVVADGSLIGPDIGFTTPELRRYLANCGELISGIHQTTLEAIRDALQARPGRGRESVRAPPAPGRPTAARSRARRADRAHRAGPQHEPRYAAQLSRQRPCRGVHIIGGIDWMSPVGRLTGANCRSLNPTAEPPLLHPNCTMVLVPLIDVADLVAA